MKCDRNKCRNKNAEFVSSVYGNLCSDCMTELKSNLNEVSISDFMDSPKQEMTTDGSLRSNFTKVSLARQRKGEKRESFVFYLLLVIALAMMLLAYKSPLAAPLYFTGSILLLIAIMFPPYNWPALKRYFS